jgi:hypothetical protein
VAVAVVVVLVIVAAGIRTALPLHGARTVSGGLDMKGLRSTQLLLRLPVSEQAVISRTLGADQERFRVVRTAAGPRLMSGGVRADFRREWVLLRADGGSLSLALMSVGYGAGARRIRSVVPVGRANRVTYRHGSVAEWYASGPLGLEQGFTIDRRPQGDRRRELTVAIGYGGNVAAERAGRSAVRFVGANGRTLFSYGGLSVTDSRGRTLHAGIAVAEHRLLIEIVDAGASYPVTVDPFIQAGKLTVANDFANNLGRSVAVSGSTVVVGASSAYVGQTCCPGAAYVFTQPAGGWSSTTQVAKLTASDAADGDRFGWTVAIDASTIVVGAIHATVGTNTWQGAAYVFTESNGSWSQQQKLTASDATAYAAFGEAVALSGTTILVGSSGSNSGGAAYVFTESNGVWSQQTKLRGSDTKTGDYFGCAVAISGALIAVGDLGASNATSSSSYPGAVYVFTQPGGGWSQAHTEQAKLLASDASNGDQVGASVAISGSTIVAGAPMGNGPVYGGAVYMFAPPAGGWIGVVNELAKLTASDGASGDGLGTSVAIAGAMVVAGAPYAAVGPQAKQGAAYVFAQPPGGWASEQQSAKLTASDGKASDELGISVAGSNGTAFVGAPGANSTYLFQSEPSVTISSPAGNSTVSSASIQVTGTASDVLGLSSLTVNGQNVQVSADGTWSTALPLKPGANTITATATGTEGQSASQQVTVTFTPPPPHTAVALSPTSPNGSNGWFITAVHATVSASDPNYAVTDTRCVLDPPTPPASISAMTAGCLYAGAGATITADGRHTLYVASQNAAGVQETPTAVTITIDRTPPTVRCSGTPSFALGSSGAVVQATVSDTTSGPASATASAPARTSSPGAKTVQVTGSDTAGNSASATCAYKVDAPQLQPTPTLVWAFLQRPQYTLVSSLVVSSVPAGATVKVTCAGPGCPFRSRAIKPPRKASCKAKHCSPKRTASSRTLDLTSLFAHRHLAAGDLFSVSVVKPNTVGKIWLFNVRRRTLPAVRIMCLAPGSSVPDRNC